MSHMNSTGDESACTDELKVYKDEGEEEEQKKSSENLTEDKVGLVIEGEGHTPFDFNFIEHGASRNACVASAADDGGGGGGGGWTRQNAASGPVEISVLALPVNFDSADMGGRVDGGGREIEKGEVGGAIFKVPHGAPAGSPHTKRSTLSVDGIINNSAAATAAAAAAASASNAYAAGLQAAAAAAIGLGQLADLSAVYRQATAADQPSCYNRQILINLGSLLKGQIQFSQGSIMTEPFVTSVSHTQSSFRQRSILVTPWAGLHYTVNEAKSRNAELVCVTFKTKDLPSLKVLLKALSYGKP
ncbi:unnamed protein product [Taenia asiatica]|uniref:Uncharacterized protein n=1 Tax=Taenia asiatica TaxID=60517 RepID=A0A0R3W5M8_TAEAS|nr:unnamed protein product [Taenia asiatica]